MQTTTVASSRGEAMLLLPGALAAGVRPCLPLTMHDMTCNHEKLYKTLNGCSVHGQYAYAGITPGQQDDGD